MAKAKINLGPNQTVVEKKRKTTGTVKKTAKVKEEPKKRGRGRPRKTATPLERSNEIAKVVPPVQEESEQAKVVETKEDPSLIDAAVEANEKLSLSVSAGDKPTVKEEIREGLERVLKMLENL